MKKSILEINKKHWLNYDLRTRARYSTLKQMYGNRLEISIVEYANITMANKCSVCEKDIPSVTGTCVKRITKEDIITATNVIMCCNSPSCRKKIITKGQ